MIDCWGWDTLILHDYLPITILHRHSDAHGLISDTLDRSVSELCIHIVPDRT